ncbi:beta-ketoacyl-ACP synthase III [Flammeovirgaceae bacterium SG7u.111]|nr:beta-ketoacyl-ACP synthase III [Flammeovirgaceae bacterium SG7u.132]WPO38436.1 beta-ketoacyl-ACP synthase III [Flammeovirgaceae bacterium SG7u.111]
MNNLKAAITGVASYLPEYVLTNQEIEKLVDTNDQWIRERSGIVERRILKGEGKGSSYMGIRAVKNLLEKTNTDPADIDLIICSTVTPDMMFPATANIIANGVGATNSFSFDMNAACSGFLFALSNASQYIETGRCKKVVVVGAEKMSSIVDYTDRTTCILFGDAASAVLVEPDESGLGIQDFYLKTDGSGEKFLNMKAGGSRRPASHETVDNGEHFIHQEGRTVFKFAVTNMADAAEEIMKRNNLTGDDVAYLVPHQANKRIIEATANRMGVDNSKVMLNIQNYGNTTSATIPLCLWDYENKLKKGDNLVLAAFGGGFTWGSLYLKWAYDPK